MPTRQPCNRDHDDLHVDLDKLRQLYLNPRSQPTLTATTGPLCEERVVVAGGAGFVGSHLVDRLMLLGAQVVVIDDFSTGRRDNIAHWMGNDKFSVVEADIRTVTIDDLPNNITPPTVIFNLASPASPPYYQRDPMRTLSVNVDGCRRLLDLCVNHFHDHSPRFILASTSEVYGDPQVHPQPESYCGHVNTIGPRACYDEGKRVAETITAIYHHQHAIPCVILRIFNTYGPRMQPDDGRVVSNFIVSRLGGEKVRVHGDGTHTRSFQFIHDLVDAFLAAAFQYHIITGGGGEVPVPVFNVGCPDERSIDDFVKIIDGLIEGGGEGIVYGPADVDDPRRRKPDIDRAMKALQWRPRWSLEDGLRETIMYFQSTSSGNHNHHHHNNNISNSKNNNSK